jgi:hypothetical protein
VLKKLIFVAAMFMAGQAGASTALFEDFSGGINGWTATGATFGVRDVGASSPGDPALLTKDADNSEIEVFFGNGWAGDLSSYDGGVLSLDFIHGLSLETSLIPSFGRLTIFGGGQRVQTDMYSGAPSFDWMTTSVGFTARPATFRSRTRQAEGAMAKLAFLGLGVMGYPMAGHLKAAGHEVTVYNRTAAKAEAWAAEHGGAWARPRARPSRGGVRHGLRGQ